MLYVISAIVTSTSGESDQQPFLFVVYPCSSSWVPGVIDSKWDVSACKGARVSEGKQSAIVELEDFLVVFWDVLDSRKRNRKKRKEKNESIQTACLLGCPRDMKRNEEKIHV